MRFVLPFIVAGLIVAGYVLAELHRRYAHANAQAAHYASTIVECANGRSFLLGDRIVHCVITDVQ